MNITIHKAFFAKMLLFFTKNRVFLPVSLHYIEKL